MTAKKRILSLFKKEKGSALVIAILIMVALTVMGLGIMMVTDIEGKISDNYRSQTQALYLAESGVERVISYFNSPSTFTDTNGTYSGYTVSGVSDAQEFFDKRRVVANTPSYFNISDLSQFDDSNDDGSSDGHDASNPVLKYNRDTSTAQQTFLESITPDVSDQRYIYELMVFAPPAGSGAVATVRVTAKVRKTTRTVEQILMPGPTLAFTSGLSSGAGATWHGNTLQIHWGSVKIQGTTADIGNPLGNNPCRTPTAPIDYWGYGHAGNYEDRWIRVFAGGVYSGPASPPVDSTYDNPPDDTDEQNYHQYDIPYCNLFANQTVTIDNWDYHEAKRIAQRYGTYYTTKTGTGLVYLDGEGSGESFKNVTNTKSCGIVFVDTTDQLPPASDGSNLDTLSINGAYYTSGIFYIGANLSTSGLGSGNSKTVQTPPFLSGTGTISSTTPTELDLGGSLTSAQLKVGDIILIGKSSGPNWTSLEELKVTGIFDTDTVYVVSTVDAYPNAPGTTPALDDHNNHSLIITTTTDETTRVSVSGFDYNFSGAIYCAGTVDMQGGPRYFGSIVAKRGFTGGGCPEIWFDWNLTKCDLTEYGIPNVTKGAWKEIY